MWPSWLLDVTCPRANGQLSCHCGNCLNYAKTKAATAAAAAVIYVSFGISWRCSAAVYGISSCDRDVDNTTRCSQYCISLAEDLCRHLHICAWPQWLLTHCYGSLHTCTCTYMYTPVHEQVVLAVQARSSANAAHVHVASWVSHSL